MEESKIVINRLTKFVLVTTSFAELQEILMTARTKGAHHIGLTVPDIKSTETFFVEALGFKTVGGKPDYPAVFVSDGTLMITLWQAKEPNDSVAFDRHCNIGLHHLALSVGSPEALDTLGRELAERDDVTIEFTPESLGSCGLNHMMCFIPGNIRLELVGA